MTAVDEILEITLHVAETLERLGVPYLLSRAKVCEVQRCSLVSMLCGRLGVWEGFFSPKLPYSHTLIP